MTTHFSDALYNQVARFGPACVGLDPILERIPAMFQRSSSTREAQAAVLYDFCEHVVDQIYGVIGVVKLQSAYFELLGYHGVKVMEQIAEMCEHHEILTIMDGKRGDIGPTSTAYAKAYLYNSTYDAMTVAPYMGSDSIRPFVDVAIEQQRGIFVLVRTSNPGGDDLQEINGSMKLYEEVAEMVHSQMRGPKGENGYHSIGFVVGATNPTQMHRLRMQYPDHWFLIPGYGAQGAALEAVLSGFNYTGMGAIVNNSRAILYPEPATDTTPRNIDAIGDAAKNFQSELKTALAARKV
jgi:orotidine-5'-phosphate decarboxylase